MGLEVGESQHKRQRLSREGRRTLAGGETTVDGRYQPMRPGGAQDPTRVHKIDGTDTRLVPTPFQGASPRSSAP